jgi:hypothetical protein
MKKLLIVSLFFLTYFSLTAQVKEEIILSGNLSADIKTTVETYKNNSVNQSVYISASKKSPMLGGLFSLILPGAGEIYAGEYLKAGVFLAVEAAAIIVGLTYDKKGDDKTIEFQNYADDYWDVVKYAEWMNMHLGTSIPIDPNTNLKPWERINFDSLNYYERKIPHFSHTLPRHGDQQYYEQIGKYHQYTAGWKEFDNNNPNNAQIPPQYSFYSSMRGEANSLYNVASTAVIVIYVNHFLSALDAIWSVSQYNKNIAMKLRLDHLDFAGKSEFFPSLNFSYSF